MNKEKRKLLLVLSAIVFVISLFIAAYGFSGAEYYSDIKNLVKNGEKVEGIYTGCRIETPIRPPYQYEFYYLKIEYETPEKIYSFEYRYSRKQGDYEFLEWCRAQTGKTEQMLLNGAYFMPADYAPSIYDGAKNRVFIAGSIGGAVALGSIILWGIAFFKKEKTQAAPYLTNNYKTGGAKK